MKHALALFSLLIALTLYVSTAFAEATFITDKIKVDLYSLQNQKGVLVKSVTGGTPVKVLKTEGEFHLIRTSDNKAGWVPTVLVSTEKPVQIEYMQLLAKYEELNKTVSTTKDKPSDDKALEKEKKALAQARKNLSASKAQIKKLEDQLKAKDGEVNSSKAALDALKQEIALEKEKLAKAKTEIATQTSVQASSKPTLKSDKARMYANQTRGGEFAIALKWFIIGLLLTLLMGFMLGRRWVDAKIRKRHGGLRLYS